MSAMPPDDQLTPKELAYAMRLSVRSIYRDKARGFLMPRGRATLAEYRRWAVRNLSRPQKTKRNGA